MRPLRLLSWGLVFAIVAHAAATYGALPERIPTHFDLNGVADRFSDRTLLRWFMLPGVALGLVILFETLTALMRTRPELLNIPDRERFVRLPARFREPVDAVIATMLDSAALSVVLVMGLIQWHQSQLALGRPGAPGVLLLLAPLPITFVVLLQVMRITNAVDAADRRWKDAGSPTT
ncbi:MAG: DUF1648 domain-containing protein [Gemmatimonadetes bacterium]|nr:DUF1648 domain-containing protein [Gemmatimonadota bacterium]